MTRLHSQGRYLGPAALLITMLIQPAQAEVVEYPNIIGTTTLVSATGPTPDSPVKITYDDGTVWNMYCREDDVGTTSVAGAGLTVDTTSKQATITYAGETYNVPSPIVYTGVAGYGILVKASASEEWYESTGPSVDTRYTNSASFTFLTTNIGREFTGIVTEKQDYFRNGQVIGSCFEKYRIVGRVASGTVEPEEVAIMDLLKGWVRGLLIDEEKSKNSDRTRYTAVGVRG